MKRLLLVLILAAVVVLAVVYALRLAEHRTSKGIAALLPRDTVAFAHLPDFNGLINDWHRSDLYQIYREPAVHDFLQRPISQATQASVASDRIREFKELDPKDTFVAVTAVANNEPKLVAGFRYRGTQQAADRVISSWRAKVSPSARHERVSYQNHDIDVYSQAGFSLVMVYDREWFFAGNDVNELKAVLDRADGRNKDPQSLLSGEASFADAISNMPTAYALLVYVQPKSFSQRLAALKTSVRTATPDQMTLLQQIHSVCAATRFDRGKMHDVIFVGMPKQEQNVQLGRSSLPLAGSATILYAANLVDFSKQIAALFPTTGQNVLGTSGQRISAALAAAGITPPDWDAAFGSEIGLISDWSEQSRWPSLLLTAAVKDAARARKIIDALSQGGGLDERWEQTDRDGVHYWSLTSASAWLSLRPVMAMSDRVWVAGLDSASVETAVRRAEKPDAGLAESENYRRAIKLVAAPTKFFAYADPALFYSRLDATLRPILMLGATFVPMANQYVDFSKIPPPEVITKHLSPIVSSQYYAGKGYIAESIGPVTLNQAGIGVGILGGVGAVAYHRFMPGGMGGLGFPGPAQHRGRPGITSPTGSSGGKLTPAPSPAGKPAPTP